MSDFIIKGETLTNIANAIRAKSGSSATMTPEQMSTEIENISVGGGDIDALIDGSITEITSNATSVAPYIFYQRTKLTSATFHNAKSIGNNAFYLCSKLTSVDFPNATTVSGRAFYNCTQLTSANFQNATIIGDNAFYNCNRLKNVNFSNVTSIGIDTFRMCHSLTNAYFPNATSIGNFAFADSHYLTSAYLPNATSMQNSVFSTCYSLTKCIIGTNQTSVTTIANAYTFNSCYHILGTVNSTYNPNGLNDGYIYVPNSLVADYRTATNWTTYASQIMPWVATVEELANVDGTTYDHACVGEGIDSVEYVYNGTTWEVFR